MIIRFNLLLNIFKSFYSLMIILIAKNKKITYVIFYKNFISLLLDYSAKMFFTFSLVIFSNLNSEVIKISEEENIYNIAREVKFLNLNYFDNINSDNIFNIPDYFFLKNHKDYICKNYWENGIIFKFNIINSTEKKYYLLLNESLVDKVNLFIYNSHNQLIFKKSDFLLDNINNKINFFDLRLDINIEYLFVTHIVSKESNIFTLKIVSEDGLWQENREKNLILGSYYGIMIIITFLLIVVYYGSRESDYIYYSIYILSILFYQLGNQGLLNDFFSLNNYRINQFIILIVQYGTFYSVSNYIFKDKKLESICKQSNYFIFISFLVILPLIRYNIIDSRVIILSLDIIIFFYFSYLYFFILGINERKNLKLIIYWLPMIIGVLIIHLRNFSLLPINFIFIYIFELSSLIQLSTILILVFIKIKEPQEFYLEQKTKVDFILQNKDDQFSQLSEVKEREKLILEELKLASEVQRGLTPTPEKVYPLIKVRYHFDYFMQVGGDLFDIIVLEDNSIAIFIADASGHGISAALLATMYKMSFTNAIIKYSKPSLVFKEMNQQTKKVLESHDYLTAFLMIVNPEGEITYSSAAHRPPLIIRKKKNIGEILFSKGIFLGMRAEAEINFEEKVDKLEEGDRILFYTDGIFNENIKEKWNLEILLNLFMQSSGYSLDTAIEFIIREWKRNLDNIKINDDATFLMVEFDGKLKK